MATGFIFLRTNTFSDAITTKVPVLVYILVVTIYVCSLRLAIGALGLADLGDPPNCVRTNVGRSDWGSSAQGLKGGNFGFGDLYLARALGGAFKCSVFPGVRRCLCAIACLVPCFCTADCPCPLACGGFHTANIYQDMAVGSGAYDFSAVLSCVR